MRLCIIADANSIHTRRWITPFIERGDEVNLISYRPVELSWSGLERLIDLTQMTNLGKLRFAYWGWWVRQYIRQIQPDILHAHQLSGGGWLGAMANYHPFVVSGWGSDILVQPQKSLFHRLAVGFVARQSDSLTVPSPLMLNQAKSLGFSEEKVCLIPWGVETTIFHPLPEDRVTTRGQLGVDLDAKVILCPRGINEIYNVHIVLKAVQLLVSDNSRLRLLLLQKGVRPTYMAQLKQLISDYGLEEVVLWLPFQESMQDMARLYRMADVVISIPTSEGYGLTVYEAMATGCPTIISDLPTFEGELIDGVHTLKVSAQDATQVSQALNQLLQNVELRHSLRAHGLEFSLSHTVQNRILQTKDLYKRLLSQSQIAYK